MSGAAGTGKLSTATELLLPAPTPPFGSCICPHFFTLKGPLGVWQFFSCATLALTSTYIPYGTVERVAGGVSPVPSLLLAGAEAADCEHRGGIALMPSC